MAGRGPVPERSDERRRRNKDAVEIEQVALTEDVYGPELNLPDAHALAKDFYEGLRTSPQSQYLQPSDWQKARICAQILSDYLEDPRRSAIKAQVALQAMTDLLVTEGERRRLRIEVARAEKADDDLAKQREKKRQEYRKAAGLEQ